MLGAGALNFVKLGQVQLGISLHPFANPGDAGFDALRPRFFEGVAPAALRVELKRAAAGDRSQFLPIVEDFEAVACCACCNRLMPASG
jgi:hypothetical protein